MFDFSGKATPDSDAGAAGTAGDVGALTGDAGGILGALGGIMKSTGLSGVGAGLGGIGNFVQGASEIAQGQVAGGLGDLGASVTNFASMFGGSTLGEGAMSGLGIAGGAMQFLGHGAEALQHTDQIDAGYQNNQFWTESGNATLGAANAVAAALGPEAQLYVGAVQGGLDLAGDVAGWINPDWKFTAGSAVGGAEHLAYDSARWVGNEASEVGSSLLHGAEDVGSTIASGASSAWDTVSSWF
jgi:hypothetical protein